MTSHQHYNKKTLNEMTLLEDMLYFCSLGCRNLLSGGSICSETIPPPGLSHLNLPNVVNGKMDTGEPYLLYGPLFIPLQQENKVFIDTVIVAYCLN